MSMTLQDLTLPCQWHRWSGHAIISTKPKRYSKMLYYMNKESRCARIMKKRGSKTSRRCPFKRAKSAIVRWKVKGPHTNAIVRSTKESFEKCKLRLCNRKTKTRAHLWNVLYLEALALYAERVLVDRYQVRVGDDVIGWAIPSNSKNCIGSFHKTGLILNKYVI